MFNKCLHASVLRNYSSIHLSSLLRWEFLFSSSCFCSRGCCCHIAFHFLVSLQIYTIFTIEECFSEKNITTTPVFQFIKSANLHSSATVRFGFAEAIPHFTQNPSVKSAPPVLFYGALEYMSSSFIISFPPIHLRKKLHQSFAFAELTARRKPIFPSTVHNC